MTLPEDLLIMHGLVEKIKPPQSRPVAYGVTTLAPNDDGAGLKFLACQRRGAFPSDGVALPRLGGGERIRVVRSSSSRDQCSRAASALRVAELCAHSGALQR